MTVINHDLRCVDGKTIYSIPDKGGSTLQGNIALPNVYEESDTALYDVGTKFVDGERVFHYAYSGEAIALTLRGATGYVARTVDTQDSLDTSQAAGLGTVANPFQIDGTSANTPAKNGYAGQYILILGTVRCTMRIVSNTEGLTASPYTTDLVLDQPLPVAVSGDTDCDIFPSRYADIRAAAGSYNATMYPVLGVPLISITANNYFWLQTWGPCFITYYDVEPGDVSYERTVVFWQDGTVSPCDHHWNAGTSRSNQFAGFTLATNGAGSEWTMLMLDR